jgi:peptide-methionine (S)-S-oxide reductase
VVYDPSVVDYETLLDAFWHSVDPTQSNGQFCDIGPHYRTAIFTSEATERASAERTRGEVAKTLGKEVVTEILPAATFWVAEAYHQDFYKKNPVHYLRYRLGCGRDARLKALWGDAAGH